MEELNTLTDPQKALKALDEAVGATNTRQIAALNGLSETLVRNIYASLRRSPSVRAGIVSGRLRTATEVGLAAGLPSYVSSPDRAAGRAFGKGDKFWDAMLPPRKYLSAWERQEFAFTHVPPKEAKKRVEAIDSLVAMLQGARADLVERAVEARLSFPNK